MEEEKKNEAIEGEVQDDKGQKCTDCENSKICAILAYLLIGIIWYFIDDEMKKDAFAKFHVKQALVLIIVSFIIGLAGAVIPFIGWFIIGPLGTLASIVWTIIGMVYAAQGQKKELPIIGQYAKKFSF